MSKQKISQSELLQWGILNKDKEEPATPQKIDSKWVDVILGKEDSARMKELMLDIQDPEKPLDYKEAAFDEFEMLVESLDNANDLKALGLWSPLFDLLEKNPEPKMRFHAAWVLGTAVQNNPKSQEHFLEADGLVIVLRSLESEQDVDVTLKLLRCISGVIKQNSDVFNKFYNINGFEILGLHIHDKPNLQILKRILFILTSLVRDTADSIANMSCLILHRKKIIDKVLGLLSSDLDAEAFENVLQLISHIFQRNVQVEHEYRTLLKQSISSITDPFQFSLEIQAFLAKYTSE